jgi:Ca2+-binding RTX toxin-like protein
VRRRILIAGAAVSLAAALWAPLAAGAGQNVIYNLAGIPQMAGYNGDNIPPLQAKLRGPGGGAVSGDVALIADSDNQRIRQAVPGGVITTIAGTGVAGFSGDGGPATQAQLNIPNDVAVAVQGGYYIADSFNHRVRYVSPTGTITTVAGTGTPGYNGDNQPATSAQLHEPTSVLSVGTGFLIADTGNNRVRFVDASSGQISTVAGNGVAGFSGDGGPATSAELTFPQGLALPNFSQTPNGLFYITDSFNFRVRLVNQDGQISTVAGTGAAPYNGDNKPATQANIAPTDIVATTAGLLIVDSGNQRIRQVSPAGTITTYAGNGTAGYNAGNNAIPATKAELFDPYGISAYAGTNIAVLSDSFNALVRAVQPLNAPKACGKKPFHLIRATSGPDRLKGTKRRDLILGRGGRDRIKGLGGADCLVGGAGRDLISGGPGRDVLSCGAGKDKVRAARLDLVRGSCEGRRR